MDLEAWKLFSLLTPAFRENIVLACVFDDGAFIKTADDKVHALGLNTHGSLGIGSPSQVAGTLTPLLIEELCEKRIKDFAYGTGPHVLAYSETGEVYAWGHNHYYQIGQNKPGSEWIPSLVKGILQSHKIIEIACGQNHNIVLSEEGKVFGWGENNVGQVGCGNNNNQCNPVLLTAGLQNKKCVSVSCGQVSSYALVNTGEIYSWGFNGNGQLGINNFVSSTFPVLVQGLSAIEIVRLMCGSAHCLALSDEGTLYTWGSNSHGQLGIGNFKSHLVSPEKILFNDEKVLDFGAHHYNDISAARTNKGIYMWGACRGQNVGKPVKTSFNSLHNVFAFFAEKEVTYKSLRPEFKIRSTLADSLTAAFNDKNTSDLCVVVDGRDIHVHKAILKIRCEYFRNMFTGPWKENNDNTLVLKQFSYPVYEAFLRYLYTDKLTINFDIALDMLELASAFCEDDVKNDCEHVLKQGTTIDNVATLYSTAVTYQSEDMRAFCFAFIMKHLTAVSQTAAFTALDESTFRDLIMKLSKAGAFKT